MPLKKGVNVLPKGKVAIKLKNSPINEKSPKSGDINPCPEGKVLSPKTGKCIKAKPEPKKPKVFTAEENKYFKATYRNKEPTEKQIHYIKTVVAYNARIERLRAIGTAKALQQIKKEEEVHKAFLKNE
jgi:hypothetical protein